MTISVPVLVSAWVKTGYGRAGNGFYCIAWLCFTVPEQKKADYGRRKNIQVIIAYPEELHDCLTASANWSNRSINAEMLYLLKRSLEEGKVPEKNLFEQLFSHNLRWRIQRFRKVNHLPSDEEAMKRLLKIALDQKESVTDILDKLAESFQKEKDLRVLANDVIANHSSVYEIKYGKDFVWFITRSQQSGGIDSKGNLACSLIGAKWDLGMDPYTPSCYSGELSTACEISSDGWERMSVDDIDINKEKLFL